MRSGLMSAEGKAVGVVVGGGAMDSAAGCVLAGVLTEVGVGAEADDETLVSQPVKAKVSDKVANMKRRMKTFSVKYVGQAMPDMS